MIDLNDVALFARVIEAGSFTGAARIMGVPKSTVSRRVSRLEAELGARLIHRTTRKIQLTDIGRAYYKESKRGLAHMGRANDEIAASQEVPSGTLRIAAPVDFGARFLNEWVDDFLNTHDRVKIEMVLDDEYIDLIDKRIDVAFRTGELESSSLIARKIGPSRRILVASPAYLSRNGEPSNLDDLENHDCVVFGDSLNNAKWRLEGPDGAHLIDVDGRLAITSAHAVLRATVAGRGIALLPTPLAGSDLRAGRLKHVLTDYGIDNGALYAVYPSNRHVPVALREFLDSVVKKVRKSPPWLADDGPETAPGKNR